MHVTNWTSAAVFSTNYRREVSQSCMRRYAKRYGGSKYKMALQWREGALGLSDVVSGFSYLYRVAYIDIG